MSDAAAVWSLGDYGPVARRLAPAADRLVAAAGVAPGTSVLDVGAGTGNVAVIAAAGGAQVTATDITPHMVELGRTRTGDSVRWLVADAQQLPFAEGTFDAALSAFGMIFAPDPERAAGEMLRVVRPGGAAAITAWGDEAVHAAAHHVLERHLPHSGGHSPAEWGDEAVARGRFEAAGASDVAVTWHDLRWTFPSLDAWMEFISESAAPIVAARQALAERWPAVRAELRAAIAEVGAETRDGFVVEPRYLVLVGRS